MKIKNLYIIAVAVFALASCKVYPKLSDSTEKLDRSIRPSAGEAKELSIGNYEEFTLANGMKVYVIENHKLPTISYSLRFDIDPIVEGNKAGYLSLTGDLIEAGTKNRTKENLDEEIDFMGANIGAYSSGLYASGLSKYNNKILDILADMTLNPLMPQAELDKKVNENITGLKAGETNADQIMSNVSGIILYGKSHPYGEIMTEATLKNITLQDCKNHYNTYFKPNNALLTIVGDITLAEAKSLVKSKFENWKKAEVPTHSYDFPVLPKTPQVYVIHKEGAVQSNIKISNLVKLKLGDADYEAVKVLNNIYGSGFSGRLFKNLREDKEYTYGAYGGVNSNKLVGNFSSSAKVRNSVTDSAIEQFLFEINRIRTEKVNPEDIRNAKNYIAGTFAQALESPRTIARFAARIAEYKLDKDYYKNYLKRIDAVTTDDLLRVAKKYMTPQNINIIVVGEASEVGEKLARFGTLNYMDKDGNKASAPAKATKIAAGVTAKTVIENYITAIGGKAKIEAIKNISSEFGMKMQGMDVVIKSTVAQNNKYYLNVSIPAMGMVMQKEVMNGAKGYTESRGKVTPLTADEIKDYTVEKSIIQELNYTKHGVKTSLLGTKTINGKSAYEIEVTMPSGAKSKDYFDVESGLKVKSAKTEKTPMGEMTMTSFFENYKEVNGVKFPHTLKQEAGPQKMEMIAKSITANGTIDESIFVVK